MRYRGRTIPFLPILVLWAVPAVGQISNPDFASDLSGWTTSGPAGTTITWDGSQGDPAPGSALIDSPTAPPEILGAFLSQCAGVAQPGQLWHVEARVQASVRPGDQCHLFLFFYNCEDCGCPAIEPASPSVVTSTAGWETIEYEKRAPEGTMSVRVLSAALLFPAGGFTAYPTTCRFDSFQVDEGNLYLQDFELYPPDWSAISQSSCSGHCAPSGTPNGVCFCDELCMTFQDCCLDACSTCGICP